MYSIKNLQSENEIYKHETIIKENQDYLKRRTNWRITLRWIFKEGVYHRFHKKHYIFWPAEKVSQLLSKSCVPCIWLIIYRVKMNFLQYGTGKAGSLDKNLPKRRTCHGYSLQWTKSDSTQPGGTGGGDNLFHAETSLAQSTFSTDWNYTE
jgi:hypothetical protein